MSGVELLKALVVVGECVRCVVCVWGGGGGYGLLTEKSINKFVVIEFILSRSMQHYNNILKLQKHITFCVA